MSFNAIHKDKTFAKNLKLAVPKKDIMIFLKSIDTTIKAFAQRL